MSVVICKTNVCSSGFYFILKGKIELILFIVFNATFSNIAAISWRPALVVEEGGVPVENHRTWASNWRTLSFATASLVHRFFVIYKAGCEPTPYW